MPTKTSNSKSAWSAKDIYNMIFNSYGNAHVNANKARAKEASKYMIPYIPEKEIMLTTGRYNTGKISTNLLDSIYNAAQRTGVPLDIALGLAGRESTLGIGRGFKKGKSISGTDLYSNWQQIQNIPNNKAQIKKWNSLLGRTDLTDEDYDFKSGFLIRAQDSLENTKSLNENPIDNALKFYQTGKYNPGDSRHTQMVEDDARILMSDPAIQKWLQTKNNNQMKCGGRRKAEFGLDIREGGIAQPIANNMWYIHGRKHEDGGVTMGPNNKNGVEVEGGEVVEMIDSNHPSVGRQFKAGGQQQTMRVFSSVPFLRGVSPAQLVLGGANPNKVFKAQEEFKDRNRINDDGTSYKIGGEKKSNSAIRTEEDKKVPARNRAIYSAVDATADYPTWWQAIGLGIGSNFKTMINPDSMNYTVTDSVADAAWRKRLGLSYNDKFLIPNKDGSVRLPRNVEMEIPTDTTMLKKRIADNEKFANQSNIVGEDWQIVQAMMKKDKEALEALRKTYKTGEPVVVNEYAHNSRKLSKNGELIDDAINYKSPLNVMRNYTIQYDPKTRRMNYWDTYDFNEFDWGVPGESFKIKGSVPLKKFGGNMIYTINGNIKNGLMNVRPKAQYGLANKYLKKKNVSNKETPKTVSDNKKQNYDFENDVKTTLGVIGGLTAAEALDYNLGRLKNYFNSTIEPSLEISQEALDKYNENYVRKTQGKTNKGFTPKNPLNRSSNYQATVSDMIGQEAADAAYKKYTSFDNQLKRIRVGQKLNPNKIKVTETQTDSYRKVSSRLSSAEQRKLDKDYKKAVGNKEPKSGFGAKPADKIITMEYPDTSIDSKPTNVVGKTYDPTVELRQANKPKPVVNTGLNNYLKKLGKGVKGLGVVGSLLDIYNNLFPSEEAELLEDLRVRMKEQSTPGIKMYKYGGRAKANYGKFLKYKNGIFTDPNTGEEYEVDPEVFKMYGNSFEEGVIPMDDYTKGTFDNARPQYYAEKRLPLFGNQPIAEKAGLTRSGWSYADNPTFDYVPKINISLPTNRVKVIGDNAKTSTSSTPRRGEFKSAVTTESKSNIAAKSKTKPAYINYSPNKVNLAVEADNPTSRSLTKIDSSSTGGGTQSKDSPWVPQYNLITGRDWLGVGANLAGHIASYFANKDILDRYPMPVKPIMTPAVKLKTRVNINPDLTNSKEAELMGIDATNRNSSSSNTALARNQRIMNESRDARNKLYAYKENAETKLINQDKLNRQGIYAKNVAAYNDWLNKTFIAKTNKLLNKQQNLIHLINGIPMAVNNVLDNIETRKSTNNMIQAMAAANPNVDGRLLGIGDYYTQQLANGKIAKYNKNHKFIKYV